MAVLFLSCKMKMGGFPPPIKPMKIVDALRRGALRWRAYGGVGSPASRSETGRAGALR